MCFHSSKTLNLEDTLQILEALLLSTSQSRAITVNRIHIWSKLKKVIVYNNFYITRFGTTQDDDANI